jgi:two-component sensor histidine kinase
MRETGTAPQLSPALADLRPVKLPSDISSAGIARGIVRSKLGPHLPERTVQTVELLTSELVTNAAARPGDSCLLRLDEPRPGVLRVAVADGDPILPAVRAEEAMAEGGRGLLLVEALADRGGAKPSSPAGKTVWFEISV